MVELIHIHHSTAFKNLSWPFLVYVKYIIISYSFDLHLHLFSTETQKNECTEVERRAKNETGFQYSVYFNLSSNQTYSIRNNLLTTRKWWCNPGKKETMWWGVTNQTWGRWEAWAASQKKHHSHSGKDPVQTASSFYWSKREWKTSGTETETSGPGCVLYSHLSVTVSVLGFLPHPVDGVKILVRSHILKPVV